MWESNIPGLKDFCVVHDIRYEWKVVLFCFCRAMTTVSIKALCKAGSTQLSLSVHVKELSEWLTQICLKSRNKSVLLNCYMYMHAYFFIFSFWGVKGGWEWGISFVEEARAYFCNFTVWVHELTIKLSFSKILIIHVSLLLLPFVCFLYCCSNNSSRNQN